MREQVVGLPRVGVGVDVHAYAATTIGATTTIASNATATPNDTATAGLDTKPPRTLWLGGVAWPGEPALQGHSDADVVAHAACDALFAAAGLADLGHHFGTSRPQWADASGAMLLTETAKRVRDAGFIIGNVSVQLVGNRPRIGGRRQEMQEVLSNACGASVSVSGTTTDGLGLTGRGEGLAAIATALVVPVDG